MEYLTFLPVFFLVWTCIKVLTYSLRSPKYGTANNHPPGPRPFPVIGNLLDIGTKPHQSLTTLSKTYGPLMKLKLGSVTTIVISSSDIAKEVLQKHDLVFSGRTVPDAVKVHDHDKFSMVWSPVPSHCRNIRKICAIHMFSLQQLNSSVALRRNKVQELLDYIGQKATTGDAVDIGHAVFTTLLNSISNTMFSFDLAGHHSKLSEDFKTSIWSGVEEAGSPNVSDYFPLLKFMDPQGIRRRMNGRLKKVFALFENIIKQRLEQRSASSSGNSSINNDVLDALINVTEENDFEFNFKHIIHLLMDLFVAGTDTSTSTVEWAMAELLRKPKIMTRAKMELDEVIGKEVGLIQESDISRLPYLQAIVKETLRLHPPGPFLLPHKSETEIEISGLTVPKNAQVLVNVWAIGRDSRLWSAPNSFVPERFLGGEIDYKGRDFELIPFGSGRRMCPALPLAHRMVHLVLGSLLYTFNWKLENGMKPEDIDMNDKLGMTLQKVKPVRAIPIKV